MLLLEHLLLLLHLVLLIVRASVLLGCVGSILDLSEQRRVLGLDHLRDALETLARLVHVVLSDSVLVSDELFHRVFFGLLKAAAVELYVLVLNTLLEDQVGAPVEAHREEVMIARWVLDAVVDHLDQHRWIVSEAKLQAIRLLELIEAILVNPRSVINTRGSLLVFVEEEVVVVA